MEIDIADIKAILGVLCAAIGGLWWFISNAFRHITEHNAECQQALRDLYKRLIETGHVRDLRIRHDPIDFEDRRE